jgi:tRNA(fMet)-specific endonuclease VapC
VLKKSAASGRSSRHEWVLRLDRFQSAIEVLVKFNANASRMAISSITLGELMHGAEKSQRVSENLLAIEDFCSRLEVLPYGTKAAQHYGAIRAALEKLGQSIGVNDLHIAGHARSEGVVLVAKVAEFERVPALELENWVAARD